LAQIRADGANLRLGLLSDFGQPRLAKEREV
jgi:hypothetical protein